MNASEVRQGAWEHWKHRLERRPDGTWFNPECIDDESFFQALEEVRQEPWAKRDPAGNDA